MMDERRRKDKQTAIAAALGSIMLAALLGCVGYCAWRKFYVGRDSDAGSANVADNFNDIGRKGSENKYKQFNDDV